MEIREATESDWPCIWPIFRAVVGTSDTFAYAPDTPEDEARRFWTAAPARPYVAVDAGEVVGTYYLRPVQPGLGSHVANAGFMVASAASGRGFGRALGTHALAEARRLGYAAMQFNFVVSTNERAVRLWQSLGFAIIGTVPGAFRHRVHGPVPVYIMYRAL
ncbi:GNAT family N-acetyltransferase [Fimbriiglobus ruber]